MEDEFDLNRFVLAQNINYAQALAEVKAGRKQGHWIWYIFPQISGLGRSTTSVRFSIKSLAEAKAYLENELLKKRLVEISETLLSVQNKSATEIFGSLDSSKVKSSMTLFHHADASIPIFKDVLDKYYNGHFCKFTLKNI